MKTLRYKSTRGSALVFTVLFSIGLCIIIGSMISWVASERRMNQRAALRLESRNAAEGAAEWGFYQIRAQAEKANTWANGSNTFCPGQANALSACPSGFIAGSNVPSSGVELFAGKVVSSSTTTYIDPNDPSNANDPFKGQMVFQSDVPVYAKATASQKPAGADIVSYMTETITVRLCPLFANAIFYNMDVEFTATGQMDVTGPTHVNGNFYAISTGTSLNFKGPVSITGGYYHCAPFMAMPSNNPLSQTNYSGPATWAGTGSGASTMISNSVPVTFLNAAGSAQIDITDIGPSTNYSTPAPSWYISSSTWYDSTMGVDMGPVAGTSILQTNYASEALYRKALFDATSANAVNFTKMASQVYGGNLLTGVMGITTYTPPLIGTYTPQTTYAGSPRDNANNTSHAIIEPATPATIASVANVQYNAVVEKQKYANKASIYIQVTPPTTAYTGSPTTGITYPAAIAGTTVKIYVGGGPTTGDTIVKGTLVTNTAARDKLVKYDSYTDTYSSSTYTVTHGLYDNRRNESPTSSTPYGTNTGVNGMIDIIRIDIDALRDVVTQAGITPASQDTTKALDGLVLTGSSGLNWNGVVYVEVVGAPTTNLVDDSSASPARYAGSTNAATNSRAMNTGVMLVNGRLDSTHTKMPSAPSDGGLTIATNVPLYVVGHYNSDGANAAAASSATTVDSANELPCSLVADAVTLLSPLWPNNQATYPWVNTLSRQSQPTAPSTGVEVAAAILSGAMPTDKNGNGYYSGGANNFPHFLENWYVGGTRYPLCIRGSLVCMFESRVDDSHFYTNYYGPPNRNWGFSDLFKNGRYPPATPMALSYRRYNFSVINAAQYAAAKALAI